jgi:hypothetical protein
VGVGTLPMPMNDRVLPCVLNVETRGVDKLGNGTGAARLEVSVIVDGVLLAVARVDVGDGGKTKSVCDGVETDDEWSGIVKEVALAAAL